MDKEKKKTEKKESTEDSLDWFEDHENYDKEKEDSENEDERNLELLEDEEEFNRRVRSFLSTQPVDVSLEKMLEVSSANLEESVPQTKEEEKPPEENFDYMKGPGEESSLKYQAFSPDTGFSKPDLSSTDRVLEEQKSLYKHFKSVADDMAAKEHSNWNEVNPEDTMKKDYLTKKQFKTGPY